MDYGLLKTIHVASVLITFTLFFGRGLLMLNDSALLGARWLRIVPHVNDTVLLGSAIWMAVLSHQYPFVNAWLTAKLAALVVYIGTGTIALSGKRTKRVRVAAWLFSLLIFVYIVSVALTRNPVFWDDA